MAEVSIYVHEDYQHQGVGQLLLEALAKESERNGIWTLEALIFDDNLPSLALFQKCGYVELGVRQKLGYDTVLQRWRNGAQTKRTSLPLRRSFDLPTPGRTSLCISSGLLPANDKPSLALPTEILCPFSVVAY
mgnify:CR=1 FL=1